MLRWLLYVVLAIWAARLARLVQPRSPRRPVKDFHPRGGEPDPGRGDRAGQESPFDADEIVDGEYEDIQAPRP